MLSPTSRQGEKEGRKWGTEQGQQELYGALAQGLQGLQKTLRDGEELQRARTTRCLQLLAQEIRDRWVWPEGGVEQATIEGASWSGSGKLGGHELRRHRWPLGSLRQLEGEGDSKLEVGWGRRQGLRRLREPEKLESGNKEERTRLGRSRQAERDAGSCGRSLGLAVDPR